MRQILHNIVVNIPDKYVMDDLMYADYILHVKVNSIETLPWIEYPNKNIKPNKFRYNVNATVLDTLKGQIFQQCNNGQYITSKGEQNKTLSTNSNICFNHVTGSYINALSGFKIDTSLLDTTTNFKPYNLKLNPGQELVIFNSHKNYLWDYNFDYFEISLNTVLPVINGQVKDINGEWSNSIFLHYNDWKTAFMQKVNLLQTGGY